VSVFWLVHGPIVAAKGVTSISLDVRRLTVRVAKEDSATFALRRDL
jgi:hypothetical protein